MGAVLLKSLQDEILQLAAVESTTIEFAMIDAANYHVWFSTKGRKAVLHEEIRALVIDEFRRVAEMRSIDVLAMEAVEDHVHLLLALKKGQGLATVVHDLKGASARTVLARYPELRLDMHSNSFWQKSYGRRLVPRAQVHAVKRYIETQDARPLRHE